MDSLRKMRRRVASARAAKTSEVRSCLLTKWLIMSDGTGVCQGPKMVQTTVRIGLIPTPFRRTSAHGAALWVTLPRMQYCGGHIAGLDCHVCLSPAFVKWDQESVDPERCAYSGRRAVTDIIAPCPATQLTPANVAPGTARIAPRAMDAHTLGIGASSRIKCRIRVLGGEMTRFTIVCTQP